MKTYILLNQYQIVSIEKGGDAIQISFEHEGIQEKDFVYLSNHPDLKTIKYEVVKIKSHRGTLYADLVRIPIEQPY